MVKILVVDDHHLVCTGITSMLDDSEWLQVVGTANSGEEAYRLAKELTPDIILMDIRMPGMGGLEATRKILERLPETKVIGVTACDDRPYVERFFDSGAQGFLTKGSSKQELLTALKTVLKGQRYISPELGSKLALNQLTNEPECPFSKLSSRELEICLKIAEGHKTQELADLFNISPKTINTYRYRAFEKLEVDSDVKLTHLAIKQKLIKVAD